MDRIEELRSDINNLTHLIFSEPPIDLHLVNISHKYGCETTVNASCSLDDSSDTNCTTDFFTLNRTVSDDYEWRLLAGINSRDVFHHGDRYE